MITRFYVDNYKCLVNFEYKPKPMELIIGGNGSGKTTVFEALDKVRQFLEGKTDAKELFSAATCTKWAVKSAQVFELDFENNGVQYQYRLELDLFSNFRVEKETIKHKGSVYMESLWRDSPKTIVFDDDFDDSDPFEDDHSGETRFCQFADSMREVPLSDSNKSMMISVPWRHLRELQVLKLNPPEVSSTIARATPKMEKTGSNFASYYLYLLQQKQGLMFDVIGQLRDVLPGFDSFTVEEKFEEAKRELHVNFHRLSLPRSKKVTSTKFSFDELSDGQRALIVLYTLVYCALDAGATLVIDEPENYIGLLELQPLILLMEERVRETGGQILLISHNREFINMLTDRGVCTRFYRENNGHTRIAAFNPDSELAPAEIVASGMEDDE